MNYSTEPYNKVLFTAKLLIQQEQVGVVTWKHIISGVCLFDFLI